MFSSNKTGDQPVQFLSNPLSAWLLGFDYVFGYQLKLVRELWGIAEKQK